MTTPVNLTWVDLDQAPFSVPDSRFVVTATDGGLTVYWIRYEIPLEHCVVVRDLKVVDGLGQPVGVAKIADATLTYSDGSSLSVLGSTLALTAAEGSHLAYAAGASEREDPIEIRTEQLGAHGIGRLVLSDQPQVPARGELGQDELEQAQFARAADKVVRDWMAKAPRAANAARQPMVDMCWWVLGINTLTLNGEAPMRVVVPSKRGYVGHWQWDAYFIAVGLRHGDLDLAIEQMEVALKFQTEEGLLPDVVHEEGVLASSDDLPMSDRANLERTGYDTTIAIPLTKPPLTAWAMTKVLENAPTQLHTDLVAKWLGPIEKSAQWWFKHSDADGDGVPEYSHPYSSGLDDSPVFDYGAPVETPDLTAYLSLQDRILADLVEAGARGTVGVSAPYELTPAQYRDRAQTLADRLGERWDADARMFVSVRDGKVLMDRTIVSLLGVVAPGLPADIVAGIIAELADPARFGAPVGIPTVAQDDPSFAADRMWRGPIWVNTAYLVADGLERNGHGDLATQVRTGIMAMVEAAGGPSEYYNPISGVPSPSAVRCFGWSAALYIDLAVTEKPTV